MRVNRGVAVVGLFLDSVGKRRHTGNAVERPAADVSFIPHAAEQIDVFQRPVPFRRGVARVGVSVRDQAVVINGGLRRFRGCGGLPRLGRRSGRHGALPAAGGEPQRKRETQQPAAKS